MRHCADCEWLEPEAGAKGRTLWCCRHEGPKKGWVISNLPDWCGKKHCWGSPAWCPKEGEEDGKADAG